MIPYHKLRGLDARRFIRALERDGFCLDHQTGSHKVYRHADGRRVVVPYHHPADTFRPKTLKRMIEEDAGWAEADLRRLGLLLRGDS
jgi:predicted RNA binding protein YcfA (HicA-like mRNA interferase family)